MATIRVVVADDDPRFCEYLRDLIEQTPGMVAVGFASDGIATLQLVERLLPDVVALDIDMPRLDGVEAARLLMERHPEMGIVLVSGTERMDVEFIPKDEVDRKLVGALIQAGAGSRRLRVIRL